MPRMALVAHIGRPPQGSDFDKLAFPPIARVVEAIRGASVEKLAAIDPVSPDKLKANALTDAAVAFLNLGRKRERLVEQFFEKHPNPTLGEDVAAAFRQEYARLRFDGLSANHIFAELQSFTSGSTRRDPEHEAAVFAVLSYFFERCDIFEAQSTTEPS